MANPATEYLMALSAPPRKRITDFDNLVQLFPQWQGQFEQLTCGHFEGTFLVASGRFSYVHFATANQSLRIRGREGPGICTFTLVSPTTARDVWQHRRLDPGCLVVRSGEVDVDHRTSKQSSNLSFFVAEAEFRRAAWTLKRIDPGVLSWLALNPPPDIFRTLEERLQRFLLALAEPSATDPQDTRLLEQACLATAVEAMFPVTGLPRMDLPLAARGGLVRRAEELMRARLQTPTGEIDLCTELGVSGRTLRLAFHERFALGPMAYYQTLRLNAARSILKTADPKEVFVAQVARDFGFAHLGKFAGYYRRLFGEKPSDTLTGN